MESSEKIREYTNFFTVLGIIVVCIVGLVVFISGLGQNSSLIAFLAVVGVFVAIMWLMLQKWLLYGFADIVANTSKDVKPKDSATNTVQRENIEVIQKVNGDCAICGRKGIEVNSVSIKSNGGTKFKNICDDCLKPNN